MERGHVSNVPDMRVGPLVMSNLAQEEAVAPLHRRTRGLSKGNGVLIDDAWRLLAGQLATKRGKAGVKKGTSQMTPAVGAPSGLSGVTEMTAKDGKGKTPRHKRSNSEKIKEKRKKERIKIFFSVALQTLTSANSSTELKHDGG